MQFDDNYIHNQFHTIIDAESDEDNGDWFFTVYDEVLDRMFEAQFDGRNSPIETDESVPASSLNEIRRRFKPEVKSLANSGEFSHGYQTYALLPGAKCSRDEFAMILFLVDEWLYFG